MNLTDLKDLDPRCKSESGEKVVQLIWYHLMEALKPAANIFANTEYEAEIRGYLQSLDILVIDRWKAFELRTNREFDRDLAYVSSKSTLELLFDVIIETQTITDIGRTSNNTLY